MTASEHFYIYVHTNIATGLRYVGQTIQDPERRWRNGGAGYKKNTHFWRAIQKYGWETGFTHFYFEVESQEIMDAEEQRLIALFDSRNPNKGYNRTTGGEHPEFSEASCQKMRDSHIGTTETEEHKNNISKALTGVSKSEEHRKHLSEASMGKKMSEEACQKMSAAKKGTHESEEHKQKISKALKGIKRSAETRKKMSEAVSARPTKCNLGISQKEDPKAYAKAYNTLKNKKMFTDGTITVKWTTLRNWIYRGKVNKADWTEVK